jgi:hypothetical protein
VFCRVYSRTSVISGHGGEQCEDNIDKCIRHFAAEKNTRKLVKFLTVKRSVLWGKSMKRGKFLGLMRNNVLTKMYEKQ